MIRVAWGFPERSVSETDLLACLQLVAVNFDESPQSLKAVLGPAGRGVRWLAITSTPLRGGRTLMADHFTEAMQDAVAELLVVTREASVNQWVTNFEHLGTRGPWFELDANGRELSVSGDMPKSGRRDGQVDVVGLSALGLRQDNAFALLERPTHEVQLRIAGKRPTKVVLTPAVDAPLPVHATPSPRLNHSGDQGLVTESFPYRRREVLGLEDALAFFADDVEPVNERDYTEQRLALAARLAQHRGVIDPVIVELLQRQSLTPRTIDVCVQALGLLGSGAELLAEYATKPSTSRLAVAALARQGERARGAVAALVASKDPAGGALTDLLDARDFEPLRAIRAARAELSPETLRMVTTAGGFEKMAAGCTDLDDWQRGGVVSVALERASNEFQLEALFEAFPKANSVHAVGLFLFENELPPAHRWSLLVATGAAFGAQLRALAKLLIRSRYRGDRTLEAIAEGAKLPTIDEGRAEPEWLARVDKPRKATKPKAAVKKKKRPTATRRTRK